MKKKMKIKDLITTRDDLERMRDNILRIRQALINFPEFADKINKDYIEGATTPERVLEHSADFIHKLVVGINQSINETEIEF